MKKFAIEIKWGIRYIFCYLAWAILEKTLGIYGENMSFYMLSSLLFYIFAGLIYSLALREKKTNYFNGHMDWKQGCATGLYMTIVIALLMPLAQASFHELIAPEFFENMINASKDKEAAANYFNLRSYIIQSIFFTLSIGMVISAIVAYFVQTKKQTK
ncbi:MULTISPECIES: DUF4199 domain-containing protein [Flavobacterium]|jgi:hypothetical membrane protein|uniref:Uncharacterized protein DUF4199 n=1 Tax=Flavobacterium lindanitolerans TaxID=428988 RepID=A0A497UIB1_9FLAO|nr:MULTISPECIES: DUF4199 domain-containing protein [Flavobacterium]PZO22496.1 MAG: DUF4199 domain-containing protein [Flavobacteriaceae bacterium]PZQ84353.1 MAG: DUF4199 domain-containing protein [Flavobacterium johnsoniae]KQS53291.1 hypothetical protein ASG38_00715 [Flavobacterium sp. Leaf359]MBL7868026.1 DUF4199 domain-containing protein [Flavobacterium lindanitolerans]PKW21069.1 uncharacterized protein DUF4199 [Flavobacterium lindanitolerans]